MCGACDEPKAALRNVLLNQKVGECIVVRKGHPYTRLKTRFLPDPQVDEKAVASLRIAALKRWGKSKHNILQELAEREAEVLGTATNSVSPLPAPSPASELSERLRSRPTARKAYTQAPVPALPVEPPELVLEVRDVPAHTTKPKRSRRKRDDSAS